MPVDDLEFREFFAAQFSPLYWLGLLVTGDAARPRSSPRTRWAAPATVGGA